MTMELKEMKKIIIKEELCMGCGACVAVDPDHFEFGSNGLSVVKTQDNADSSNVANAIDACPSEAIVLEECKCEGNCQCEGDCQCEAA